MTTGEIEKSIQEMMRNLSHGYGSSLRLAVNITCKFVSSFSLRPLRL